MPVPIFSVRFRPSTNPAGAALGGRERHPGAPRLSGLGQEGPSRCPRTSGSSAPKADRAHRGGVECRQHKNGRYRLCRNQKICTGVNQVPAHGGRSGRLAGCLKAALTAGLFAPGAALPGQDNQACAVLLNDQDVPH
jgi:hypothetical protein